MNYSSLYILQNLLILFFYVVRLVAVSDALSAGQSHGEGLVVKGFHCW